MQHLFAPWRFAYVSSAGAAPGCIFCAAAGEASDDALVLARSEHSFALLNRYPYTSGHAMVAPFEHTADLITLDGTTLNEMMALAQRVMAAIQVLYAPHGFNVGMNLGETAGAGVVDHLHLHVVPRWRGDSNFMSVTGGVRVLPEDLATTLGKLRTTLEGSHG